MIQEEIKKCSKEKGEGSKSKGILPVNTSTTNAKEKTNPKLCRPKE